MNPNDLYPSLSILTLQIQISISSGMPPSFYLGSTWRGILGWELKNLVCPFHGFQNCQECTISDNCPYYVLFEKKSAFPGIFDAPRGYIIYAPDKGKRDKIYLEITLLGHCSQFLPPVIHSLAKAQSKGLGKARIPFSIMSLSEYTPRGISTINIQQDILSQIKGPFKLSEWVDFVNNDGPFYRLTFPTPLRLRQKGKYLSELNLKFMFLSLARRLEAIHCIFSGACPLGKEKWLETQCYFSALDNLPVVDDKDLELFPGICKKLKWDDYSRFSNRQRRKVPMGGLVGECLIVSDLKDLGSWIRCAELLHVGKGAAMGLGKVKRVICHDEEKSP